MTNEEYIKLLEARIENLEIALKNLTKTATLKNAENITFSDCTLNVATLAKCKNITFVNNKIETGVFTALKNKFNNFKIGKAEIAKSKIKFKNCSFEDINEKE